MHITKAMGSGADQSKKLTATGKTADRNFPFEGNIAVPILENGELNNESDFEH